MENDDKKHKDNEPHTFETIFFSLEDDLTQEEINKCIREDGILDMDKYSRKLHQNHLKEGKTNIKDFDRWLRNVRTFSRPWMR